MRFSVSAALLGAVAFASGVVADVKITACPNAVVAGSTYTISYSPPSDTVEFVLREGASNNLKTVTTLGSATGGNFTWVVANSLVNGADYAVMVQEGSQTNYWGPIALTGGRTAAASSSSAAASSSSAAASSASSALSSLSSAISSLNSSIASATASHSGATTLKTASATTTKSTSATATGSSTTSAASVPTGNSAAGLASPMALIFGAVAAMAYLN